MNKMLTFFTAPVTALFYPPVYQDAAKSSASRGVLYVLYLAGLSVILAMIILSAKVMPEADALAGWMKTNIPVLIWTPAGLSLENGQTTATLTHPQYGTIALFDMTKTNVTEADMGKAFFFVTATKAFIKKGPGRIEARDITGAAAQSQQQLPPRVRINGDVVGKFYQNIKNTIMFVAPIVLLVFSFMFFLMTNLFYSLAGLLLNLMRSEKLRYGAIFNLTCFATTAAVTLTWLRVLIPLKVLAWPLALNIVINLVYLFVAFKVTDKAK